MRAQNALILRHDTHLDVLLDRLKETRIAGIIDAIIAGCRTPSPFPAEDVKYAIDLGLITEENGILQIANPIYQEVILKDISLYLIARRESPGTKKSSIKPKKLAHLR